MRIAYFSCQMPYPPTHGGLVDDWRRLRALHAAGADLALVTWYPEGPASPRPQASIDALHTVARDVHAWGIGPGWRQRLARLWGLRRWPASVASRIPRSEQLRDLWRCLDAAPPQAVWLDSMHPLVVARWTAQRYGVPLYYRSHNREHEYVRRQVARASHWRTRLAWAMNLPHLGRTEREAIASARVFFDISVDDLASWKREGFAHGQWLPPLVEPELARQLSEPLDRPASFDVAYLGNLYAPNNVEGMLWFLREVWPAVRAARPLATLRVAGSQPVQAVREAVGRSEGVTLLENAPDVIPVLRDAHVLINPVFAGSGVNVKSVEMLFSPAWLVSAPQGVAGLPGEVQACFEVAETSADFARAVLRALDRPPVAAAASALQSQRTAARQQFGFTRIRDVLAILNGASAQRAS